MHKPTISKSQRNDEIRRRNTADLEVDQGEDEGGEGESRQTQRRGIGELAVLGGLVETGLEFTTEGRETRRLGRVRVQQRVAAVVVGADLVAVGGAGAVVDGVDSGGFVVDRDGVYVGGGHGGGGWFVRVMKN